MISAILLAAGESSRMGRLKVVLPLGDTTVIRRAIRNLFDAKVEEVVVVLGHRASEIKKHIRDFPVRIVINRRYREGMLTSIWAGIAAADPNAEGLLLALADQPMVEPRIIRKVISAFRTSPARVVLPEYEGRTGHPIALDPSLRPQIMKLDVKHGLRALTHSPELPALRVPVNSPWVRFDLDTPEDYRKLLDTLNRRKPPSIRGTRRTESSPSKDRGTVGRRE